MTMQVEAIFENGVLKPASPISLPNGAHVKVTIDIDPDRIAWLKASDDSLLKAWDNDADDVFNELLDR